MTDNAGQHLNAEISDAGLPGDPVEFKVLSEIDMIASLAKTVFERMLPTGVTAAQFGVLNRLARLDRKETISELARAFMVAQPTMSSTVKKLVQKNYVILEPIEHDKRAKIVNITDEGKDFRTDIIASAGPAYRAYTEMSEGRDWTPMLTELNSMRRYLEKKVYTE